MRIAQLAAVVLAPAAHLGRTEQCTGVAGSGSNLDRRLADVHVAMTSRFITRRYDSGVAQRGAPGVSPATHPTRVEQRASMAARAGSYLRDCAADVHVTRARGKFVVANRQPIRIAE